MPQRYHSIKYRLYVYTHVYIYSAVDTPYKIHYKGIQGVP